MVKGDRPAGDFKKLNESTQDYFLWLTDVRSNGQIQSRSWTFSYFLRSHINFRGERQQQLLLNKKGAYKLSSDGVLL
jgi:hypothetical protein